MKKFISMLVCVFAILSIFPVTVYADIGLKPSVVIDFNGLAGETYYATLLSSNDSTGPYSAIRGSNQTISRWKPFVYAMVANVASFALGLGLSYWIPGIF